MTVMFEEQFICKEDDYTLCKDCVKKNPPDFVGTCLVKARAKMEGAYMGQETFEGEEDEEEEAEGMFGEVNPDYEEEEESNWGAEDFFDDMF